MNSRIFIGQVKHERLKPVRHQLAYPLYVYCFDLDELTELDRTLPLFGYNRPRPASLYDRDYLDDSDGTVREKLTRFLEAEGYADAVTTIMLVTSARYFNYIFNPVSFYYCFSRRGDLVCVVAEVNNTFGERHVYIPRRTDKEGNGFPARFSAPKHFHVSPFNDMTGSYEFVFSDIRKELFIRINLYRDDELAFYAELWGTPVPLTASGHAKVLLSHPLIPHLTIPRIYWEAVKLFFVRKLPYHEKPVPLSMMTIRRNPPTLFQKRCMNFIVTLLNRIRQGAIRMTLPDGTARTFGPESTKDPGVMDIHDYGFFSRIILGGDIGLGEAYVDGLWDSPDPVTVISAFIENRNSVSDGGFITTVYTRLRDRILHLARANTPSGARRNIRRHYDLSNDFFETFLDRSMTYSCGIFNSPGDTLEDAQKNKHHAVIEKARITADDHVLEIGCGWGSFAVEAARTTGCRLTGVTISDAQYEYARERIRMEGLSDRVEIVLKDYREIEGRFDRIVSIEMLEAVGDKYFEKFFECCDRLLKPGGVMVLQFISIPDRRYDNYRKGHDWIRKHIFPGGGLPSLAVVMEALAKRTCLNVQSVENIGPDYALTLRNWRGRFLAGIDEVAALGFDHTFQRKWVYYLAGCEACFATRYLGNLQMVMVKSENGY